MRTRPQPAPEPYVALLTDHRGLRHGGSARPLGMSMLPLITLSAMMAGCMEFPVDCSGLPPASAELIGELETGSTALTDEDVLPGTVQLVITMKDFWGLRWYSPVAHSDSHMSGGNLGGPEAVPYWGLQTGLACAPEAAASVQFLRGDGDLVPGEYPMAGVSFDVPEREQGADDDTVHVDGIVTITAAGDGLVSGYMQGRGGATVKSYLTQESVGLDFTVEALAFKDFPLP